MKKVIIIFGAMFIVGIGFTNVAHAYSWLNYNGHEYSLTDNWEPWVQAEQEAISEGGHLVTINDAAEDQWLTSTFDSYAQGHSGEGPYAGVDIGYYFDVNSNAWQWISGEPVTYTNLYSGFPNGGTEAYLHLAANPYNPGEWNAVPDYTMVGADPNNLLKGIIERKIVVTPEPLSAVLFLIGGGAMGLSRLGRKFSA